MFYVFLSILLFVLISVGAISSAMPNKATNEELNSEDREKKGKVESKAMREKVEDVPKSLDEQKWQRRRELLRLLLERKKRQREKAAADAEWNKLRGQADELFKNGAEVVVIAFRNHPDNFWEQGSYLPTGVPDEVKAAKFCVLTRDGKETWNQLPEKFKESNLDAFSQKCKAVYVDDYSQLVRDGWGTWNFVRRDGVLELVWKLTGYGEKERREREEKAPGSIYDLTHRGF